MWIVQSSGYSTAKSMQACLETLYNCLPSTSNFPGKMSITQASCPTQCPRILKQELMYTNCRGFICPQCKIMWSVMPCFQSWPGLYDLLCLSLSLLHFPSPSLSTHPQKLLAHGNIVVLKSVASGKSLRVFDDARIDGTGGTGLLGECILNFFQLLCANDCSHESPCGTCSHSSILQLNLLCM